jgi:allophanate hydrolase subunit 2
MLIIDVANVAGGSTPIRHDAFPRSESGVWIYVAVEGGFSSPRVLGSASANPRAGFGSLLRVGDILSAAEHRAFGLPAGVSGRIVPVSERRNYRAPPPLRIWPAPQAHLFSEEDQGRLCEEPWQVLAQSDRVGYRLTGTPCESRPAQIPSEPVRVGTIQVPEDGQPIVTMRDGPTVGGYPKLGLVDPRDFSWLAQCRPGQEIRFQRI